jgi:conjugal transfer pilus assembly protein TraF
MNGMSESIQDKTYFEDRERGWFWYETNPVNIDEPLVTNAALVPSATNSPKTQLKKQGDDWENAMAAAVINPSSHNVQEYLLLTKKINEQAQKFATAFKESIWVNPEYDYSLENPVSTQAMIAQNENNFKKSESDLKNIAREFGILFFFRGDCPFCHRFSPLLKKFSEKYGFTIIPVTTDGGTLAEYPHPQKNMYLGSKLNVSAVPALYLVNPSTNVVVPASFGYSDWSALSQKILSAAKKAEVNSK